jgi:hypothetical protein
MYLWLRAGTESVSHSLCKMFLFSANYVIHDCTLILPFCSVHMLSSLILRCPRILLVLGRGKNLQFDGEILLKISLFVTLGTQIEQRTNGWKYK